MRNMKTLNTEAEVTPESGPEVACPCCGEKFKVSLEPVEAEEDTEEESPEEDAAEGEEEEDAPPAKSKKDKVSLAMDFFGKE